MKRSARSRTNNGIHRPALRAAADAVRWALKTMKIVCFMCFLSLLLMPSDNPAAVNHLSDSLRKLLMDAKLFRPLKSMTEIPPAVIALCSDSHGRMADIGRRWESTDFITKDTLPRKRLIWAVVYRDYYLVHYERGGIGHSFHVLFAQKRIGERADLLWRAVGERYSDAAAFRKALTNNKMDDDPRFAY